MGIISRLTSIFTRRTAAAAALPPAVTTATTGAPSPGGGRGRGGVRGQMVPSNAGRMWEPGDDDRAKRQGEQGQFLWLAQLVEAMRGDGLISGLLSTRAAGMWALPVSFEGDPWLKDILRGRPAEYDPQTSARLAPGVAGMWKRLLPRSEATAVIEDATMAGAGVGYMDDDPREGGWRRLRHLDLHWLTYSYTEDAYFYDDPRRGRLRVTPGDGRWVLFTPYGRHRPWARGAWVACARPFIAKYGAGIDRLRFQRFLADGLRYLEQDDTASEAHADAMAEWIMEGWSYGPGVVLPKGFKAGVVESTGKGYEVYQHAEARADAEIQVALSGQKVTAEGNKGFSSGDLFRDIALTLIQTTADEAAECFGDEVLDPWTEAIGLGRDVVRASWDTRDPAQREAAAAAAKVTSEAIKALNAEAAPYGRRVKLDAFLSDHGVAVELEDIGGAPRLPPAPPPGVHAPLVLGEGEQTGEPLPDEAVAALAEKMTRHRVDRCPHGSLNRCRLCGVERTYDFELGPDGAPAWGVAWRPIRRAATASRAAAAPRRTVGGVVVVVEHPAGSTRTGKSPDGSTWSTVMSSDYGRIPGTVAPDGEAVDVYLGPDEAAPAAFIVSQVHRDGSPDEPKVMLGFRSEGEARAAYLAHVPPWCFGGIEEIPAAGIGRLLAGMA